MKEKNCLYSRIRECFSIMSNVTLILLWEGIVDTVEVNDNLNEITPLMTYQQQSKKGLNNIAWTKLCYLSAEQ